MIKFEHVEVTGWKAAIRGMRNPKESWNRGDSFICPNGGWCYGHECPFDRGIGEDCGHDSGDFIIGPNDMDLMKRLAKAGSDHRKFMRYLTVTVDITAPLYWWKEFDTYKVGTVANSESTMHCIHKHEFTMDDFSCEHLFNIDLDDYFDEDGRVTNPDIFEFDEENHFDSYEVLSIMIGVLNFYRKRYLELDAQIKKGPATAEMCEKRKQYWWQMIQLLPSSYNQKRTVQINYETLANIRRSRRGHKLDEWSKGFMEFIDSLPYSEIIDIAAEIKTEEQKKAERSKLTDKIALMRSAGMSMSAIATILEIPESKAREMYCEEE